MIFRKFVKFIAPQISLFPLKRERLALLYLLLDKSMGYTETTQQIIVLKYNII